jgi:hypothetical protein
VGGNTYSDLRTDSKAEDLLFDFRQEQKNKYIFQAPRPAVGPIQFPIQCIWATTSVMAKRSGREADHLSPTSSRVKNE